jgi:YcxB-like protein
MPRAISRTTAASQRSVASEGTPLEVDYEITRDDLYAFQWRAVFESARSRRARRTAYLLWLLAILLFAIVPAIGPDGVTLSRVSFTFIATSLLVALLLQWCLERWLVRHAIRQLLASERPNRGQLGRHRLILGDDGLTESTVVGEARTRWAGVDRIEQSPDYIYIYTSPAAAHIVPKRAFPNSEQADAFYRLSQARRQAAG